MHGGCTIKGWLRLSGERFRGFHGDFRKEYWWFDGDILRIQWDFTPIGPPGTIAKLVYFTFGEFYGLWQI